MSSRICTSFAFFVLAAVAPCQEKGPDVDWPAVGKVLGVVGKVLPDGAYRVDLPRTDPPLRNEFGFVVPPSTLLSYAAFTGDLDKAVVSGDTCLLGAEVNPVIDALRKANLEVVALHNHMLASEPTFFFVHFQGKGPAMALAKGVRAAWDEMGKHAPAPKRDEAAPPKPDWGAVSELLGLKGAMTDDGTFKVSLPRPQLGTALEGTALPAGIGLACWAGFAPCACGETMVMGDTCLRREELQQAIDAYRRHGVRIVGIHNHLLGTAPELVFCHFAAEGDAMELARAVKAAWEPLRGK